MLRYTLSQRHAAGTITGKALLIGLLFHLCLVSVRAQDLSREDLRPITLSGTLITAAENYSIPGLDTRRPVNSARLYFNPTLSIYGVDLPFSFVLSTTERSFNQPFNQFGVSPRYKWLTLHGGYRSMYISDFTLNDAVILGGGAEIDGDWFHFRGMYGRFRRSVEEDRPDSSTVIRAVYERIGWTANAGIGGDRAGLNLTVLHAWDDSTSLDRAPTTGDVFPSENLVLGMSGKLGFAGGAFVVDGEAAGSFFSRDTFLPMVEDDDVVTASAGLYDTRLSTRLNFAFRLGGTYFADLWSLRLQYARVEPEYETMGALYTQSDLEDITIIPTFQLADGSLRASGSLGFRHDNLFDDRIATTDRVIGSANVNWMPDPSFGMDGQYSNYSMSSSAGSLPVNDSTRIENVSESYSITPRYILNSEGAQHFFMLFLTRQLFADENILTGATSDNDVFTAVLSYTNSFVAGYGFSAALQFTEISTVFQTDIIRGVTVGVQSNWLDNDLNTDLTYTHNLTRAGSEADTDTQDIIALSARYRVGLADVLEFRFQYNTYDAVNPLRRSYAGTVTRLQYSRRFGFGQ